MPCGDLRGPAGPDHGRARPAVRGNRPHAGLLERWGLSNDVDGLARFSETVVEALADRVAVFKPQSAFFTNNSDLRDSPSWSQLSDSYARPERLSCWT